MGGLLVLTLLLLLGGLIVLGLLSAIARRPTATKAQVVGFCIAGWLLVAAGLNAAVVKYLGAMGPVFLGLAAAPNALLWGRLRQFRGGPFLSALFASSYVLMSVWNGGLEARLDARREAQRAEAQHAVDQARRATSKYRAGVKADLEHCERDPAQCLSLGDAYRLDGDSASALEVFALCCHKGDEACCARAAGLSRGDDLH